MNGLSEQPDLKEINAYKKKLTWGDVPAIYHMVQGSVSEIDGTLTHGFDNAFKRMLNKNHWNLELLEGYHDAQGNVQVRHKPQIALKHVYDDQNYELHCYPVINGEKVYQALLNHPQCPFINWTPESMQMLFRLNKIVAFILYSFHNGDAADMALLKYAHISITKLIKILSESFEIVDIIGYSLAEFCQEVDRRKSFTDMTDLYNHSNEQTE